MRAAHIFKYLLPVFFFSFSSSYMYCFTEYVYVYIVNLYMGVYTIDLNYCLELMYTLMYELCMHLPTLPTLAQRCCVSHSHLP